MKRIRQLFCKHDYRLFCNHDYVKVTNIYGDPIRYCGWYRSLWKCSKCGKYKYRDKIKCTTTSRNK